MNFTRQNILLILGASISFCVNLEAKKVVFNCGKARIIVCTVGNKQIEAVTVMPGAADAGQVATLENAYRGFLHDHRGEQRLAFFGLSAKDDVTHIVRVIAEHVQSSDNALQEVRFVINNDSEDAAARSFKLYLAALAACGLASDDLRFWSKVNDMSLFDQIIARLHGENAQLKAAAQRQVPHVEPQLQEQGPRVSCAAFDQAVGELRGLHAELIAAAHERQQPRNIPAAVPARPNWFLRSIRSIGNAARRSGLCAVRVVRPLTMPFRWVAGGVSRMFVRKQAGSQGPTRTAQKNN